MVKDWFRAPARGTEPLRLAHDLRLHPPARDAGGVPHPSGGGQTRGSFRPSPG